MYTSAMGLFAEMQFDLYAEVSFRVRYGPLNE